jgi:plasmid stabilization system protein ParE
VTRSVVFAPEARDDLFQLYDHIAADAGAERARSYTDRIIAACTANLKDHRGRRRFSANTPTASLISQILPSVSRI